MESKLTVPVGDTGQAVSFPADHFIQAGHLFSHAVVDLKYFSTDNFMGRVVPGYERDVLIMTRQAAYALLAVEQQAESLGLGLKIFDAYRPQMAVDAFIEWARDESDTSTQADFYPALTKQQLFSQGYLVARSSHSRGSTVDLTLYRLDDSSEVDMGTPFDFFDPRSWPLNEDVSQEHRQNRMLLRRMMLAQGFEPLETEWWHFTLGKEPYPDTVFDFAVK